MKPFSEARVAIVHEWLVTYAGSERVLEQMLQVFPDADVFAVVDFLEGEDRAFLGGRPVTTTFVQKLPLARKKYRAYLPIMPLAVEQLDMSGYDIIISSSHAVAKGVITGPDQLHVCYCYSPLRYAWDLQHEYLRESGMGRIRRFVAAWMLHRLRLWDARTANGVDEFIADSAFVGRRIRKAYRRDSTVIYPPVDIDAFQPGTKKEDFYLAASRLVPYKKLDLIAEAFRELPDRRLVVIGDGPDMKKLRAAAGPNVEVMGFQPFEVLRDHMQRARAFIFAAQEDFGIIPVEAQACGTPVIAFGAGGALETVRGQNHPEPTGIHFNEQTPAAIAAAVRRFESIEDGLDPARIRDHAGAFSTAGFRRQLDDFVAAAWERHAASVGRGERPRPATVPAT